MHDSQRKLSTTVFFSILVYSIIVVMCFAGVFSALFYFAHESEAEKDLSLIANDAAKMLDENTEDSAVVILEDQFDSVIRYTLIAADGSVLYDSQGSISENHADRPEVKEAKRRGKSSIVRYSETLGQDTIYAAKQLKTGEILRASEERVSFFAVAKSILSPLIIALLLVVVLSIVISRQLTKHIVSPLDAVDVSNPLDNQTYSEMMPLLKRINDQKQQLVQQNQELARAENIRREFSANVSHEMKTPLQVISGYAEILQAGDIPESDKQRFIEIIAKESRNMNTLIDDVLVLSRLDDPVLENAGKEEIELLELVQNTAMRFVPLAEKQEIHLSAVGSKVTMFGNRNLLSQLVSNLISNAIRYSLPGGEVRVTVGKTLISDSSTNDNLSLPEAFIRVKDTGCGIAKEEQSKIFERFYRTDKSRSKETGGTGLGLAIAKHAAEFHGALITIDSKPGVGSTFTVHFPLDY